MTVRGCGRNLGIAFVITSILLTTLFLWSSPESIRSSFESLNGALNPSSQKPSGGGSSSNIDSSPDNRQSNLRLMPSESSDYFEQAFSKDTPSQYAFAELEKVCAKTQWLKDSDVYLHATDIQAGMTTIMSQVKIALKMSLDAGVGILLPQMFLRSSEDLEDFGTHNESLHMAYNKWFDVDHLVDNMAKHCPQMKVIKFEDLALHTVKHNWTIDVGNAYGFQIFNPLFWRGFPYRTFFYDQYEKLRKEAELQAFFAQLQADKEKEDVKTPGTEHASRDEGVTIIRQRGPFQMYRIMDDPTGTDGRVWSDFGHLIRFKQNVRDLVDAMLHHIDGPFYGVHFRAEADNAYWKRPEEQIEIDLDYLDQAWEKYGTPEAQNQLFTSLAGTPSK